MDNLKQGARLNIKTYQGTYVKAYHKLRMGYIDFLKIKKYIKLNQV